MIDQPDSAEIRVGEKKTITVSVPLPPRNPDEPDAGGVFGLITGTPTVSLYDDTDTVVGAVDGVNATGWTLDSRPDPRVWYRLDNATSPLPFGVYTLVFSYALTVNGVAGDVNEQRILLESVNAPHLPMAAKICRMRLQENDQQLPDGALLPEIDMMVRRVAQRFSTLNLTGLTGTDFLNYQDGIGILTAVKLRPGRPKRVPIGEIATIKTDLQEFRFDTPVGNNARSLDTVEATWAKEGATALRGVSAIKAFYGNIATSISFTAAAGKRSKLEAQGIYQSSNDLFNELMKERLEPYPFGWTIWGE